MMTCANTSAQSGRRSASLGSRRGMGSGQRLTLLLVAGAAVSLGTASPCRAAGLVIEAPTLTSVAPGSSGSFDVLLIDTDPTGTAGYNVSGNSLELTLSGPAGFTFTDATVNTSVPYIYVQSTDVNLGVPFSSNTFPNTDFVGGDAEFASPFFRTVNPGDIFGLVHVSYTVAPTAFGTATITIANLNVDTSLSDINGSLIPFTAVNGSISTVPEPATWIQGATAALIGVGGFWRRRSM